MRFIINRNELLKGLGMVLKAIPQKAAPLPILNNVKMELTEKGLELTGSDDFMSVRSTIPYMIGENKIIQNAKNGSTLVACRILVEVVRHLTGDEISFELIDNSILKIDDSNSSYKLNSIKADEYPNIDMGLNGAKFDITASDMQALVEQTAFAAATKETRPVLVAVNLAASNNILVATATDTARLARKSLAIDSDVSFSCNVQARKLLDIVRSFEGANYVTVSVSDKKITFAFDRNIISCRLTNGDYPNTKNIVPKSFNYFLEINSKEFISAMERASLLSAENEGIVKLSMTEDKVEMTSRSSVMGSASEKLSVFQYSGDSLIISFRSSFVADAIKALKSEDVTIAFIGDMKPFVVKNTKDDTTDMLITPIRS